MELDLRDRRLILGGLWRRQKKIPLTDARMLYLCGCRLYVLCGDGTLTGIAAVPEKDLPKLLELLPDIASGMGDLPVGFANSAFER